MCPCLRLFTSSLTSGRVIKEYEGPDSAGGHGARQAGGNAAGWARSRKDAWRQHDEEQARRVLEERDRRDQEERDRRDQEERDRQNQEERDRRDQEEREQEQQANVGRKRRASSLETESAVDATPKRREARVEAELCCATCGSAETQRWGWDGELLCESCYLATSRAPPPTQWYVGDRVHARYDARLHGAARTKWFPGTIHAARDDDEYDVAYDDGDFEARVPAACIKAVPGVATKPASVFTATEEVAAAGGGTAQHEGGLPSAWICLTPLTQRDGEEIKRYKGPNGERAQ